MRADPLSRREAHLSLPGQLLDLSSPRTPIVEEQAVAIARDWYGLNGQARRFATEKDDTFLIETGAGERFVLKIAHPSEPPEELDLQVAVLKHLECRAPDLPVPRLFPDRNGAYLSRVEGLPGQLRLARLMSFLTGTVLDKATATFDQQASIGEILAELRLALSSFAHAADNRIVAWDVTNLLGFAGLAVHVRDLQHRRAVEKALSIFAEIEPKIAGLRQQVLHNDFNTSNIVVDNGNPRFVNGIIDFGDTVRTAIAVDVSTALMNQMPRDAGSLQGADPFAGAHALLRGYLRRADLSNQELELIPVLCMGRVALRGLLTSWRASLFPENADYILRNTAAGWWHLDWFLSLSPRQMRHLLTDRLLGVR